MCAKYGQRKTNTGELKMSKTVNVKQGLQGILSLGVNTDWNQVDADLFQKTIVEDPVNVGVQFTTFLKNGGRVIVGKSEIVQIDRIKSFDPSYYQNRDEQKQKFVTVEEDNRSLTLTEVDIGMIRFESCSQYGYWDTNGEDRINKIKTMGYIRLDAQVFHALGDALIKDEYLIHERYRQDKYGRVCRIYFDGTILLRGGRRYVCYLSSGRSKESEQWHWYSGFCDLGNKLDMGLGGHLSAVIAG